MSKRQIYLDYNASTPLAPEVKAYIQDHLDNGFGNPSSQHWAGKPAHELVETARARVANLIGCKPHEIVFLSGGSEANNTVLKGICSIDQIETCHIITTQIEHPATTEPCRYLENLGAKISWLPVDGAGHIDPEDLRKAITTKTSLVSIMHANNELGTMQPIAECAAIAKEYGVPFHTDSAQSLGKVSVNVDDLGIDMLSIAGHKIYAPKGIGALYVRDGITLKSLIHGAGHESGRRAGTESALMAGALGVACEYVKDLEPMGRITELRNHLWSSLNERFGNKVILNGHPEHSLPNTANISFIGYQGADILAGLETVAASTGSACHEGSVELSPVLRAIGASQDIGKGAVRFSLGRETTRDEIDEVIDRLSNLIG